MLCVLCCISVSKLYVNVTSVQVLGHYRLRLGFSDGSSRDVNLAGELHGPVFEALADPDYFAQVRVDDKLGTVVWPNGADLPTSTLSCCTVTSSRLIEWSQRHPSPSRALKTALQPQTKGSSE